MLLFYSMEKIDKRLAIISAAEKLFCEFGYEGTSTRQIAKESGANMAMINYYFGSKEGVFIEIMSTRISSFKTQLDSISDEKIPALEKLQKVIQGYTHRIVNNVDFHKIMHRELTLSQRPDMEIKIKDAIAQNLKVIENIIKEGIAAGNFKQVDCRMLIVTIMGTISNAVLSPTKVTGALSFNFDDTKEREKLAQRIITHLSDLITTYLSTKK